MSRCGDLSNPKLIELKDILSIPRPYAVGIIEGLGIFTSTYCRRGFIGKYSNEVIADWLEWDRSSPDELIEALIKSGWITAMAGAERLFFNDYNGRMSKAIRRRIRIKQAGGEISRRLRFHIYERDGWHCKRCGISEDLTIDHIIPICAGGDNEVHNLQALCRRCNSSKKDSLEHIQ